MIIECGKPEFVVYFEWRIIVKPLNIKKKTKDQGIIFVVKLFCPFPCIFHPSVSYVDVYLCNIMYGGVIPKIEENLFIRN